MTKSEEQKTPPKASSECFIIMPISDPEGYDSGHFERVYEDLFKPACDAAGYSPLRGDEVTQTNLIHLDILQRLVESPMAICDLSSRNPNVLFELGLRQAFDRPTVLVQEKGTPKIFDIAPLRYVEYRPELRYREVLDDQLSISNAIKSTKQATDDGEGINSLIGLMSLAGPAKLKEPSDSDAKSLIQFMRAEMDELRSEVRYAIRAKDRKLADQPSRYSSIDKTLDESHRLLTNAEKYLASGEFKRGYDSIGSAQRRLERVMDDKRVTKHTMMAAHDLMIRALELEKMMTHNAEGNDAT